MKILGGAVVSGIVLGLSLNYPACWFLSLIGLIPFLYIWYRDVHTNRSAWKAGFFLGAVLGGAAFLWIFDLLPIQWSGITSPTTGLALVLFMWSLPVIGYGLLWGLWGLLLQRLLTKDWRDILIIPISWIFIEWLSAWAFALVTYSPQSLLGPHYTFKFIGYALSAHPLLLQTSRFGGVYTLSFIVILCNALLYWLLIHQKINKLRYIGIAFFALLIGTSFIPLHQSQKTGDRVIEVALLHTNFPTPASRTGAYTAYHNSVYRALLTEIGNSETRAEVIVLPEDTRFTQGLIASSSLLYYDNLFGNGVTIIDSGLTKNEMGRSASRVLTYETGKGIVGTYDKKLLAPFGEYLPTASADFLTLFGLEEIKTSFARYRAYEKGTSTVSVSTGDIRIGTLLCSELVSPILNRDLKNAGAELLVNEASQGRFHGSRTLFNQIQAMAKVRAVENNLPFLYAGNVAPSFILDTYGAITAQSGWGENSVLRGSVRLK